MGFHSYCKGLGHYKPCQSGGYRHAPLAVGEDTREAIAAARRAFDKGPWRKMSQVERGKLLLALACAVREHAEEFAQPETQNSGKPIRESRMDISDAADCFEFYGGLADKINGDVVPVPGPNIFCDCH